MFILFTQSVHIGTENRSKKFKKNNAQDLSPVGYIFFGEGNGNHSIFLPRELVDRAACGAAVHEVTQSQT